MDTGSQQTLSDCLGQIATGQPQLNPRELPLGRKPRGKQGTFLCILKSFPHCRLFCLKNVYQPFGKFILFLEINANLLSKEGHLVSWINLPASSQWNCAQSLKHWIYVCSRQKLSKSLKIITLMSPVAIIWIPYAYMRFRAGAPLLWR